jgi:hypothetical protein
VLLLSRKLGSYFDPLVQNLLRENKGAKSESTKQEKYICAKRDSDYAQDIWTGVLQLDREHQSGYGYMESPNQLCGRCFEQARRRTSDEAIVFHRGFNSSRIKKYLCVFVDPKYASIRGQWKAPKLHVSPSYVHHPADTSHSLSVGAIVISSSITELETD